MPWYLNWTLEFNSQKLTDGGIIVSPNLQSPPRRLLRPKSRSRSHPPWRRWRRRWRGWGWRLLVWAPTCCWRRDRDKTGPWSAKRRRGEKPGTRSWVASCLQRQTSPSRGQPQPAPSRFQTRGRGGATKVQPSFSRFVSSPLFNSVELIFLTSSHQPIGKQVIDIFFQRCLVLLTIIDRSKHSPYHAPDLLTQRPE